MIDDCQTYDFAIKCLRKILPDLTLGELTLMFLELEIELNRRLRFLPISDTLDFRSSHIRKEVLNVEPE